MKAEVEHLFNNDILEQAIMKFSLSNEKTLKLNSFESFIFTSELNEKPCILRITHSSHRTVNEILGEIDWINYLAENGASVCKAYPSVSGQFVEKIELVGNSSYFCVSVFEKAEGVFLSQNRHLITDELIEEWGRVVGELHRLTKTYPEPSKEIRRNDWANFIPLIESYLENEPIILEKAKQLTNKLMKLPKNRDCFGLIHYDLHHANFLVDNGKIRLFDFDDSEYGWFIADLSVIVFTALWANFHAEQSKEEFVQIFIRKFMVGYRKENSLEEWWLTQLADFVHYRFILLYAVLLKEYQLNPVEWIKKLLDSWKPLIESDKPYVNLDFLKKD
ncbi:MAG: phosphotransferase [Candidatus Heimdallarchaeota archaeon]|nr:phosphotransferase [Candidatus Heimdallarchaeota archaeon]